MPLNRYKNTFKTPIETDSVTGLSPTFGSDSPVLNIDSPRLDIIGSEVNINSRQVNFTHTSGIVTFSGTVGVGTTVSNPGYKLNVFGKSYFNDDFKINTNTFYVDTVNNRIGIGTTNPVTLLHISDGNGEVSTALYTSDYLTISAQNTSPGFNIIAAGSDNAHRGVFKATRARGTLSSPTVPLAGDSTFSLLGSIYDGSTNRATAAVNMEVDGDVGVGTAPQRISFWTGTGTSRVERARITGSGNIGIGTTNPTQLLQVGLTSTQAFVVTSTGSVGIGTTTPVQSLQVGAGTSTFVVTQIGSVGVGTTTPLGILQVGIGTSTFVVTQIGSVGVGTTNPIQRLQVGGGGTSVFVVTGIGSVGIGTTIPRGGILDVNGIIKDSIGDVRAIPQNSQITSYTLAVSDVGKHVSISTGGVTVTSGIFTTGSAVSIYNNSGSNQTISLSGVTMYLAGTSSTGNRTLAQRGICTILCVGPNTFVASGAGLT